MASSTNKKVIVVRFDRESIPGYVSLESYRQSNGIELLTAGGNIQFIPYQEVKSVCFVKAWDESSFENERKEFTSRPKIEGLWVKFNFRDGDAIESLLPNRLHEIEETGFTGAPPDASSNTQRIFVPRAGLSSCVVLGVIGTVKKQQKKKASSADQLSMFD